MTSLTMTGVRKGFAGVPVLCGVDLDVPQGSITAVLGPSGCGKTTLLRILAGFLAPDAGRIAFGDTVVVSDHRHVPPQLRRVGYVPQEGALFPHLDVAANVTFGLPRRARRGDRLGAVLDLVELPRALAARRPHELSGGQQQRVALARALAPGPAVVLLDEPFSSLDAGLRSATGRAITRALRAASATAVLVTHDQDEALSLADQVAVMRDGTLAQVARPVDLYHAPVDTAVATFVGGATLLPATVTRSGDTARSALGELQMVDPLPPGPVSLLVRPEQIELVAAATPATNGRPGVEPAIARVSEVCFYGHDAAVHLIVAPSGTQVVARVLGVDPPEVGAEVHLAVRGCVRAYAAS